jgi:hypothetical protein
MEKLIAMVGDTVQPDEWKHFEKLSESDGYSDSSFPGCQFRINTDCYSLAVNITITGRKPIRGTDRCFRCKVEFVGDGEPSVFSGGRIWINH